MLVVRIINVTKKKQCRTILGSLEEVIHHLQITHKTVFDSLPAIYSCQPCKSSFKSKQSLFGHNQEHHTVTQCTICEQSFESIKELKKHSKLDHSNQSTCQGKRKCLECQQTFKSESDLDIHLITEHSASHHKDCTCYACSAKVKLPKLNKEEKFYRLLKVDQQPL